MARKVVQKTSFLGGEAGPLVEGRSDLAQFQLGVAPGQNFITLKGGAKTRRPGTRYVKNTQGDNPARLIPFVVSYDSGSNIYVVEIAAVDGGTSLTFRVIRVSDNSVYTPTGSPALKLTNCVYATTAALPTVVYANGASGVGATLTASGNGALSIDGGAPSVGQRILVKNQATLYENGIYTVTDAGSAGTPFILTRATDFDTIAEALPGSVFYVTTGTTNATTYWKMTSSAAPTMGTSAILFTSVSELIDLNEIQFSQSAEFLFITSKYFEPQILYRASTSPTFTLTPYISYSTGSRALGYSLPYRDTNVSSTTITLSATSGTGVTATASASLFDSGHVGTYFSGDADADGDFECSFIVRSVTSATVALVDIIDAAADTTLGTVWREGAWSTYRGFPRTVTFYSQRLVFGGNTSQPDTVWMSEVADYFQMSSDPTVTSISRPLIFTLASSRLNQIRWMVGGKKLTVGTSSSEWVGTVTNDGTNLFVQFDEETTHGSGPVQPQKAAYSIPFVQRGGRTIREMAFNFDNDAYEATDLTLFGSHVAAPLGRFINSSGIRVIQLAYQESPFNVLWALDSVGRLYGLTREKQQQIASWHTQVIGGYVSELLLTGLAGEDYPTDIQSICVVPDDNGRLDRLWMVVGREINGAMAYHVEYVDDIKSHSTITPGSTGDIKAHLDCASLATAASTVTWSGYTRFANEDVYVVAENATGAIVHAGELTVSGAGVITLPIAATKVVVGLHADAYLRLLPIEGGEAPPVNMNATKGADSVAIRMHETWGLRIGKNRIARQSGNEINTTFEPIEFPTASLPTIETFTGVKTVPVPCDEGTDISFALAMQEPWPCTILSLSTRITGNEV